MKSLFQDIPEAILNIKSLVDKIEPFSLTRDVLLPKFEIPVQYQVVTIQMVKKEKIII